MMLILPIHEHGICFYLFVSSSVSFSLSFFFACTTPDLTLPFVEEAIFTPFYASAPFVEELALESWVYFWALYSVLLIYVSVLMRVPDCFDYMPV